jgi:hypothetical protein
MIVDEDNASKRYAAYATIQPECVGHFLQRGFTIISCEADRRVFICEYHRFSENRTWRVLQSRRLRAILASIAGGRDRPLGVRRYVRGAYRGYGHRYPSEQVDGQPHSARLGGTTAFAYFVILKRSRFRTLGYRLGQIKIVGLDGQPPTYLSLSLRLMFGLLGPLPAGQGRVVFSHYDLFFYNCLFREVEVDPTAPRSTSAAVSR